MTDRVTLGKKRGKAGLVQRWVGNWKTELPGKGQRCDRKWSSSEGVWVARGLSLLPALKPRVPCRPRDVQTPQSERDARCRVCNDSRTYFREQANRPFRFVSA